MKEVKNTITIGRPDKINKNAPQPDIPITGEGNSSVSRRQAVLSRTDRKGVYILSDNGSSNGTYYKDGEKWIKADNSLVTTQTVVRFGYFEDTVGALVQLYNSQNPPIIDPEGKLIIFDF